MHDKTNVEHRIEGLPPNVNRTRSERVQGALFALLLALGAWQGVDALATPQAQRRLSSVSNLSAFFDGRLAASVNFIEAHYLPADHSLRAAGGVLRWKLFGSGGPLVTVGCGGWLYLTEEARTYRDAQANLAARADIASAVASSLRQRGTDLIIAVVPDKARIESKTLCNAPRSVQSEVRFDAFANMLRARNIPSVDLAAPLRTGSAQGSVYYRTDTHWNQRGAALAAQTIAAAVKTPLAEGFAYRTEIAASRTNGPGDLLRLMSLDLVPDAIPLVGIKIRPVPDQQFAEHTLETAKPPETDDLLAASPGDQVVLLGSSYSKNANFHGRLQEALRAPVNNLAELGGGFASAATSFFKSATFAESPPRLVVWEMPERALTKPLDPADEALASLVKHR